MSLEQFNLEITNFARSIPDQVITFQKKLVLEILSRVVLKTPVDTGRARGNWQTTVNTPAIGENRVDNPVNAGLASLSGLPPFAVVFITNNVPYIERLENGWSKQAPNGMVAVTLEEVRSIF